MIKKTLFMLTLASHSAFAGNLMSRSEAISHEMSDDRGEYRISYNDPTSVVIKVRNIDSRNLDGFDVTFRDEETQKFYQKTSHQFEQSWYKSLVLANSDKDAVCRHYLGANARYAGRYTHEYLRHLRYKLSFVRVGGQQDYSLRREWGGVRLLDKLWCQIDLQNR